ncbi:MAG: hypothetical protein R2873_00475 [Caldilineaceae bacterium]
MQQINNDSLQKRLYQHAFMDGVSELAIGVWLAGLGLYYFPGQDLRYQFLLHLPGVDVAAACVAGVGDAFVKQRITAHAHRLCPFPQTAHTGTAEAQSYLRRHCRVGAGRVDWVCGGCESVARRWS